MGIFTVSQSMAIVAVLALSLPAVGQAKKDATYHAPLKTQAILLPASDPLNKNNWTKLNSMSDEFNGAQLDPYLWQTYITGWPGRPPALIADHNVGVINGQLQITMQREPVDKKYANLGYHDYTTGAVQSTQSVLYGYFEIRAKAMNSAGSSGLWFVGKDQFDWNEIDVAEMGGKSPANPRQVFMSVHVFGKDGVQVKQDDTAAVMLGSKVADNFHVYGLNWTQSSIDFYVDGRLCRHLDNTHWHTPATMIMDAETQVNWWGMPQESDLPSVFAVDYVRAWKMSAQQ